MVRLTFTPFTYGSWKKGNRCRSPARSGIPRRDLRSANDRCAEQRCWRASRDGFLQATWGNLESVIAGKHGIECRQVSQRLLHGLRPRFDESPVNGGPHVAQLLCAFAGNEQGKRIQPLRFLVERADRVAEIVYNEVCGFRSGGRFQRCVITRTDDTRQDPDF